MIKGKFIFKTEDGREIDIMKKIEDFTVSVIDEGKSVISKPEFIRRKIDHSDDNKVCFKFDDTMDLKAVEDFKKQLSQKINLPLCEIENVTLNLSCMISVPVNNYENALIEGIEMMLLNKEYVGQYVDYYGENHRCDELEFLVLYINPKFMSKSAGKLNYVSEMLKMFTKCLEFILDCKVMYKICGSNGCVRFYTRRRPEYSKSHRDEHIAKIKNSKIIEQGLFSHYAYINYVGKYVE